MGHGNDLIDIPTKLLWLLYSNFRTAPLPLVLLLLATTVLSILAFVRTVLLKPLPSD
jgi:hypothetical protein